MEKAKNNMLQFFLLCTVFVGLFVFGILGSGWADVEGHTREIDRSGEVWYVKADGYDGNDGKSWILAFKTIQKAIDHASDGDEIWV